MKNKKANLIIISFLALAAVSVIIIFSARSPVLIVTEHSFIELYGKDRLNRASLAASIRLFRQVKTVAVSNETGEDIVPHAVSEVSSNPYCVMFPVRFLRSANLYQALNPKVPVIVMSGRSYEFEENTDSLDLIYVKTDIYADFYRAALSAAAHSQGKEGSIAVFIEPNEYANNRVGLMEAFFRGINEKENPPQVSFFTSIGELPDDFVVSCAVLAGAGSEFIEKTPGIPVILFSWLDPSILPNEVVLVIDDSPWAQIFGAAALAYTDKTEAFIVSNFIKIRRKK
ncbi:MAG: hypothetical protein FWD28_03250 [Treponema sp.]|nr:hypothetical protein [Treponema sp.]